MFLDSLCEARSWEAREDSSLWRSALRTKLSEDCHSFLPSFSPSIFSVTHNPYTAQQFKGKPQLILFPMSDIHSALTELDYLLS